MFSFQFIVNSFFLWGNTRLPLSSCRDVCVGLIIAGRGTKDSQGVDVRHIWAEVSVDHCTKERVNARTENYLKSFEFFQKLSGLSNGEIEEV